MNGARKVVVGGALALLALGVTAQAPARVPDDGPAGVRGQADRPRIGLVLSGGGARGAAHIGVLEVLERLHIPVDVVVGTSMGSIIGALYAIGYSPAQMREIIATSDWSEILSDDPPRDESWFRRRQDDRRYLVDLEFGWDAGPVLPPGLILGHNVDGFLERLTLPAAGAASFDDLRLPFRCVATDIADGTAVVLRDGNLGGAIRASMSIPGVFAPVLRDGKWLVDGGVVDNVPVNVARELGADLVIVVDVSTPLADPETLRSLFSVSDQVIGILMASNRNETRANLQENDILIDPPLGELGAMDFPRCMEAVEIGRTAGEAAADQLATLGVDDATWRTWLAKQRMPVDPPLRVRSLRIENSSALSDDVLLEHTTLGPGDPIDGSAIERVRNKLSGLGIFERVEFDLEEVDRAAGEADVVVRADEKGWGPHYIRFGLGASSDFRGSGDFSLAMQHTWTPINSYGGEWRNELEIGSRTRIYSEFYQPIDRGLRWFVAPNIEYEIYDETLIVDRQKLAVVNVEALTAGLDVGRNIGDFAEFRVGYRWLDGTLRPEVVVPGFLPTRADVETGGVLTQFVVDTLDDVSFPRSGVLAATRWEFADEQLGGIERLSIVDAGIAAPISAGSLTLMPSIQGGSTLEGDDPLGQRFQLGGFRNLSGFERRELSGNHYAFAMLDAYVQLAAPSSGLSSAMYMGSTAELGGIWNQRADVEFGDLLVAGSVYVAADTLIGPIYLAIGLAEGGDRAGYLFIGPSF